MINRLVISYKFPDSRIRRGRECSSINAVTPHGFRSSFCHPIIRKCTHLLKVWRLCVYLRPSLSRLLRNTFLSIIECLGFNLDLEIVEVFSLTIILILDYYFLNWMINNEIFLSQLYLRYNQQYHMMKWWFLSYLPGVLCF